MIFKKNIHEVFDSGFYLNDTIRTKFPKISKDNLFTFTNKLLTPREEEYLKWCCQSLNSHEIGEKMNVSHKSIEKYSADIMEKLGLSSKTELIQFALITGIGQFVPKHGIKKLG